MKEYFARLSSLERRFVVGVMLVVFLLLNWVFVTPLFADWGKYQLRRQRAADTLAKFQQAVEQAEKYKPVVAKMESQGMAVPAEDQTVNFMLTIQSQAAVSGVTILSNNRMPARTNQFFVEQVQNLAFSAGEAALIDFLYRLGSGDSLIRVRGLSLHPDAPRQKLAGNVTLVASYQKKAAARPAAPAPAPTTKSAVQPTKSPATEKTKPAEKSKPAASRPTLPPPPVSKPSTPTEK